jgi:hypothetical protein
MSIQGKLEMSTRSGVKMSDFLKGNFQTKKKVESAAEAQDDSLQAKLKKAALNSIGGSMVYVERTALEWDGDDE